MILGGGGTPQELRQMHFALNLVGAMPEGISQQFGSRIKAKIDLYKTARQSGSAAEFLLSKFAYFVAPGNEDAWTRQTEKFDELILLESEFTDLQDVVETVLDFNDPSWFASWGRDNPRATPNTTCLLYTSPSPRDRQKSRMPSSA